METNLTPIDAVSIDVEGGTTEYHTALVLRIKLCHHRGEPTQQYLLFIKAMGEKLLKEASDYLLTYQGEYSPKDNSNGLRIDPIELNMETYPERIVVKDGDVVGEYVSELFSHLADDSPMQ